MNASKKPQPNWPWAVAGIVIVVVIAASIIEFMDWLRLAFGDFL